MTQLTQSRWEMDKSGLSTRGGMVVAKQEPAALAGAEMLAAGGNAVDAAVAAAWVMAVMEPYNNSIGGSGYLVYRAADGAAQVVDYSNRAPARATTEALASRTTVDFDGPLACSVPGTVAGLCTALERFGTLPCSVVMAPAIRIAAEGMPLDWTLTLHIALNVVGLRSNPHSAEVFLVDGDPSVAHGHSILRQPQLARTLQRISDEGSNVFYEGELGAQLARAVQDRGGLLEHADFVGFEATVSPPLRGHFRDYTLLAAPLPSPGALTVQSLQLLEGFDLAGMGHNSAEALHVTAESFRLAFADRDAYFGDPEYQDDLTAVLLSDDYLARRRQQIDPARAMLKAAPGELGRVALGAAAGGGGTTHLCAVDADGGMVSLTQTLIGGMTGFGVAGDTGVLMNCSLQWFDHQPGRPNSVGPRKRPVSNMTPMIVERDGQAILAVGAPGSRRITNAVSQVALNVLEFGMTAQPAISAPRIDCSLDHIVSDDRIDEGTLDELRARGHTVDVVHEFVGSAGPSSGFRGFFARPAAIYVDAAGVRHGGDYPFAPGAVVAVE